jgi:hypothetical protein
MVMVLEIRSLLSIARFYFLPSSQFNCLIVILTCFRFLTICCFHVNLISVFRGIWISLMVKSGVDIFPRVKVMEQDLFSFILIRHVSNQVCRVYNNELVVVYCGSVFYCVCMSTCNFRGHKSNFMKMGTRKDASITVGKLTNARISKLLTWWPFEGEATWIYGVPL